MIRLALVGWGKIAPKHVEVFSALGARFVACTNRSEDGRKKAQSEGGIPNVYGSIREMLERERPDGVVDCATFPQIYPTAREVLPFGIPTLLEKPPGTSLGELDELRALAKKHSTKVMVGLNRRHYSVVTRAIEDAGGADRITGVFVDWSEDPKHVLKRASREEVARWTFGNTLHGLDLLTTLAGPIPAPSIVARSLGEPLRWMTAMSGLSARGAIVSFNSTWDAPGKWRVAFTVPDRRYLFAPLETCTVSERGKDDRTISPSEQDAKFKAGFYDQARAFLAVIAGGSPAPHDLESCVPSMQLAEALTEACLKSPTS